MTNPKELEEAKSYINYGIKEGYFDVDQFEGMSDEELIKFANDASGRAEAQYEAYRDDFEEPYLEAENERIEATERLEANKNEKPR